MSLAQVAHWVWWSSAVPARVARGLLLPAALVYRTIMVARAAIYRRGWLRARRLPLPAVAVGNLAVGGTGKTPLAAWIAARCAQLGAKPGILLRGYGGDEQRVHARLVPTAAVIADPDRVAGAARARAAGAEVLVLDDAFQRLDVARDLNIAVLGLESTPPGGGGDWPLPAGPWREDWSALSRADVIVVTRRTASSADAKELAARLATRYPRALVAVAHLALDGFSGLESGRALAAGALTGKRVIVAAGIADPASFAAQVRAVGGTVVQLLTYQDHHAYRPDDVARLARAAKEADYVVVTEKDAVKLRGRWPAAAAEPLVAGQALHWESNGDAVDRILEGVLKRSI